MIKSYKIRLYPTKAQEKLMWQHIGSCRYIWNYMLDYQQRLYEAGENNGRFECHGNDEKTGI